MRAVLVKNGLVTAAVELAPNFDQPDAGRDAWTPPDGLQVVVSNEAGAGWTYDGKAFTAPLPGADAPPVPPARDLAAEFDALKAALVAKAIITAADVAVDVAPQGVPA